MSALVVDTSSWISYFAGRGSSLIDEALEEGRLHLPPVVAAELTSGKLTGADKKALESLLGDLPLCRCDLAHWLRVGALRASLASKGLSVSTPDAHVAMCALDLRAVVLTEDAVFRLMSKHAPLRVL